MNHDPRAGLLVNKILERTDGFSIDGVRLPSQEDCFMLSGQTGKVNMMILMILMIRMMSLMIDMMILLIKMIVLVIEIMN